MTERQSIFSRRLKNARAMQGLSLDELANKMNNTVSKMAISKYEAGKMLPNSSVLIDLANSLEQNIDYFFRPFSVSIDKFDFRKKSTMPAKNEKAIKEKVMDFAERYIEIEEICSLDCKNFLLQPIRVHSQKDIKTAAMKICEKWKIGNDGISGVFELLEEHAIKIYEIDADPKFDGLSASLGNHGSVIVVNKKFPSERKRFTALHELGHLVLIFDNFITSKEKENMCSQFANEMLISESRLQFLLGKNRHNISYQELKSIQMKYGISVDALMYKAKSCNIISEQRYKTYCIKKNTNKKFKATVETSFYPDEKSSRFSRLVYKALSSELISSSKAAALLNIPLHTVREQLTLI